MKKIITIVGARPQIIKSAALTRAIQNKFSEEVEEIVVHTGQHYDEKMSLVFYEELNLPPPKYNLEIGSASHGVQTAKMIIGIEEIITQEKPNAVVVYGDTNSTLAAAISSSKIHIPIVHIEAGLRSFSKKMPEEINRILCDHVSTLLFSPTKIGIQNLEKEGFSLTNLPPYSIDNPKLYHCGDVMYDNSLYFSMIAERKSAILSRLEIEKSSFLLATVHRPANTDNSQNLLSIFESFLEIIEKNEELKIVLPLHPRTAKSFDKFATKDLKERLKKQKRLLLIPPVSFLEMVVLEKNCRLVLTDSGGLQKEAYFFQKPCVILRPETEWKEIVEQGTAIIANANKSKIKESVNILLQKKDLKFPELYGDGKAAEFIVAEILKHC